MGGKNEKKNCKEILIVFLVSLRHSQNIRSNYKSLVNWYYHHNLIINIANTYTYATVRIITGSKSFI